MYDGGVQEVGPFLNVCYSNHNTLDSWITICSFCLPEVFLVQVLWAQVTEARAWSWQECGYAMPVEKTLTLETNDARI